MEKLLTASNIPFKTAGDVHCSEGWLNYNVLTVMMVNII